LAIGSFAKVLASSPDWHLVMAGPDQMKWRKGLEAMARTLNIENRITWTGAVDGDLKAGMLRASEVLLLPSHQENFGIVVAEALAYGVPVLISNKVNIWREVEDSGGGLVAADDLDGTCALLDAWCRMAPDRQARMRLAAQDCFESRFEIHSAAASINDVLRSAAIRTSQPKGQEA
jgi:glycosyltransferase involved in cell wall biosynthesis